MNREISSIVELYSTASQQEMHSYLLTKSKDNLIAVILDLVTLYINDKNSSTLREFLTVELSGYTHKEEKIGYNGYKQDAFLQGQILKCEAKPKNIRSTDKKKLNGGGNFTDYTFGRVKRDKEELGLNILVSGFVDGKLIYIIEFPFTYSEFVNRLEEQLNKRFPGGIDISSQYLRGANFDYKNFISCPDLRIVFLLNKDDLSKYENHIVREFYKWLIEKASD